MTRNPFINALSASAYIVLVVTILTFVEGYLKRAGASIIAPIAFLSLFTLSAGMMAYLFGFEPLQLFLDGKRKAAVKLFLQTLAVFAGTTLIIFIILLSGVIK